MPVSDLDQPFTEESARELFDHLEQAWQRERKLSNEMLDYYWKQKAVTLPDTANVDRAFRYEAEKVTTQEAMRIVDLLTSLYMEPAPPALVHRDESMGRAENREGVEQALDLVWKRVDPGYYVRRSRVRGQILVGRGAQLGPMPGGKHWWNYPYREPDETLERHKERKRKWTEAAPGLPFVYMELPPESTFPASFGYQNDLVGSVMEMTYWDLCSMFSEDDLAQTLPAQKKADTKYTLFMASNRRYLAYTLMGLPEGGFVAGATRAIGVGGKGDAMLRQIQHDLGRSAIRVPAGITRSRWPGQRGYYWMPVLFPVVELIGAADKATSYVATGAKENALPTLVAKVRSLWKEGEGTGQRREPRFMHDIWHIDPGDPSQGVPPEEIGALHKPQFGQEMQQFLAWLHGRIDRISGTGQMLEGILAADTAWATKMALQYALRKHSELSGAIGEADRDDREGFLMAVEAYGEPVSIRKGSKEGGELTLSPDDAKRWMADLESDYGPDIPVNELAMLTAGIDAMIAVQTHHLPLGLDTVMERFDISDQPLEEWKKSIAWDAWTSPLIRERLLRKRLDEADALVDAEDESMSIEEMERDFARMSPAQQRRGQAAKNFMVGRAAQGARRAEAAFETPIPEPAALEVQP